MFNIRNDDIKFLEKKARTMDVDLARTFLAVVETGSFVEAAKRVFVTQSTVSMRIKSLEELMGKTLFERSKAGASMSPAGVQFQKHALAMVRVWEQARLEVALPSGYQAALTVGGQYSLWDGFLLEWVARMRAKAPDIALRTQSGFSNVLMQRLVEGTLDIGVMYTPQNRPGFALEMLFEEELVLVSSETRAPERPGATYKPGKNYIYVDWGPEFQADHSLNFPDLSTSGLYMELGSLSLKYLLENRASGYFPKRLVVPHLQDGRLKLVSQAPVFHYPAYVVYPADKEPDLMNLAIRTMRKVAAAHTAV
jgi:DNA-binding transcriptional LysR family regulator